MKKKIAVSKIIQNCCEYFSFVLHPGQPIIEIKNSGYYFIYNTKPFVLLYVKFVPAR
jgi:hypothetical protein